MHVVVAHAPLRALLLEARAACKAPHLSPAAFAAPHMVLQFLIRKEEEIRTRIHSFRAPIHDWRLRWAVTCLYFFTPIVGGWLAMPYVMPNPDDMREKLTAKLSEEDLQRIQLERDRLQREFDAARRQATRGRQQQQEGGAAAAR